MPHSRRRSRWTPNLSRPELVALYEQRADLPVSAFVEMLTQARERIDVLVYAAVFLHEAYPRLNDLLRERAADGCAVRIAVGDADSPNVQRRGQEGGHPEYAGSVP